MTAYIAEKMSKLGLDVDLRDGGWWQSYIAIMNGKNVIHEEKSNDLLKYQCTIEDLSINIESANANAGNYSSCMIDGTEYSVNQRGLNIVVYDKRLKCVVDSVCFDTWLDLSVQK